MDLEGPPGHPVRWLGTTRDGRTVIVDAKLWYAARDFVCKHFGVAPDDVLSVERVPEGQGEGMGGDGI